MLFLDTLKLYSVISRCPFSPTSTSSYDFSIAQFFSILKLYFIFLAVYSDNPSSFIHKIPTSAIYMTTCFCLPLLIIVYQRGITNKKISKNRKNSENHRTFYLFKILVILEVRLYFRFKIYLTEKKQCYGGHFVNSFMACD